MGASLCLALSALWAASLQAQPGLPDIANTAQRDSVPFLRPNTETGDPRADALRGFSGSRISPQQSEPLRAETKLRDKFNAFDYTDELPPNLGFGEFEQSLESRFFGTYVFYSKLSEEQRLQVYESYRRDRHISAIRTSTLDLLH
jgi:hypothetical protein